MIPLNPLCSIIATLLLSWVYMAYRFQMCVEIQTRRDKRLSGCL